MRTLVVVNTRSGGDGDANLYEYLRALAPASAEVTLRYLDAVSPLDSLLTDATAFDRVVAVGGDGTVSGVCYALRDTGVPVLAYPAGTANLIALNLSIHLEPRELAETTVSGIPVTFDLGEVSVGDADQPGPKAGFAVMAGAGYDASIMTAAIPLKQTIGPAAYLLGALANPTPTIADFEIEIDGETFSSDGIAVLVANFGRLQFDLEVARGASPRDGMLDLAVLRTRNIAELVPAVAAGIFDRAGDRDAIPGIDVYEGRRITVRANPALTMQYDGEVIEACTPFTATVLPGAATLLVPPGSPYAKTR